MKKNIFIYIYFISFNLAKSFRNDLNFLGSHFELLPFDILRFKGKLFLFGFSLF